MALAVAVIIPAPWLAGGETQKVIDEGQDFWNDPTYGTGVQTLSKLSDVGAKRGQSLLLYLAVLDSLSTSMPASIDHYSNLTLDSLSSSKIDFRQNMPLFSVQNDLNFNQCPRIVDRSFAMTNVKRDTAPTCIGSNDGGGERRSKCIGLVIGHWAAGKQVMQPQ